MSASREPSATGRYGTLVVYAPGAVLYCLPEAVVKSLREIKADIGMLAPEDRAALVSWLLEADRQAWDEQISHDFSAGGAGMRLLDEVDEQIRNGNFRPLE